jgi:stage V sporulation protein AE
VSGVVLSALGLYQKLVDIGGAGATIPLTGFGHNLAKGVFRDVDETGLLGAFTGGFKAASAGLAAAVFFGFAMAAIFKPKAKK